MLFCFAIAEVTENELKRLLPYASKSTIARNLDPDRQAPCPQPQQAVCHDAVAKAPREEGHPGRVAVRITSFRRRLLDPDNLVGGTKYFTDGLRYAGLLPGDTEAQIRLEVRQQKVKAKSDECTLIEIEPLR